MARLIVVSNRVAAIDEGRATAGGLAVAVLAALRRSGGIWFGWSGETSDAPSDEPKVTRAGRLATATVDLTPRDYEEYYNGFANRALWPLFHYRLDLTEFSRRTYAGYLRTNGLFAEKLAPMIEPGDMIWVHDYHLIPFGERLRQMGVQQRLGFYLHIPFPVPEVLSALPSCDALVRALSAYDVVGFQSQGDRDAFVAYLVREAGGEVLDGSLVRAFGRTFSAAAFPISIETADMEARAATTAGSAKTQRLRTSLVGRKLIIGVDRLDYSKGLPQRFAAFQNLLQLYPENAGHVTFMQIAPPSRTDVPEYNEIRRQLETLAGHINGRFAEFDWMPIRYLNKSFKRRALLGFFREARIGLVTPLRDGMNLVAKEYVAAQDPEDPGVLVLSRFAGAAAELEEGALIVNPYDAEGVADSMQRALSMPREERLERYQAMMTVLRRNDISAWRNNFLEALARAPYDGRVLPEEPPRARRGRRTAAAAAVAGE